MVQDMLEFGTFHKGLITADWHLRATVPQCAAETKEEWMDVQGEAVSEVCKIAIDNDLDVFVVGDMFHKASELSFECIQMVQNVAYLLERHNLKLFFIAGNHDLKFHSSSYLKNSAVGVIRNSINCYMLKDIHFTNATASNFDDEPKDNEFVFRHILCVPPKDKLPWVDCETVETLTEKYEKAKVLFLGDYHKSYCIECNGKTVINPGCLTVQVADMIDYQPSVYLYRDGVVDKVNIEVKRKFLNLTGTIKQDESIDTFVQAVKQSNEVSLDYLSNLQKAIAGEPKEIRDMVEKWV